MDRTELCARNISAARRELVNAKMAADFDTGKGTPKEVSEELSKSLGHLEKAHDIMATAQRNAVKRNG
jgi:hypothetical protein